MRVDEILSGNALQEMPCFRKQAAPVITGLEKRSTCVDGIAERQRAFHVRFAEACSMGVSTEGTEALIEELIARADIRP